MSSVTSLRVSKGGSKFAPKAKPRVQRPKPAEGPHAEGTGDAPEPDNVAAEADSEAATAVTQLQTGLQPQQPPQVLPSGATVIQPGGMMPPPLPQLISPPSVNEHGIPTVGSSEPQRLQPSAGTPIVVAMPGNGISRPEPRSLLQGRRESAINPPSALAPGPPRRLASLSSPMSQASALEVALNSPMSSSRRSGFGSQLNSPRVKRNRTASSTPEPSITLKLKTTDDYRLLDSDTINSLPISFFCRDTRHGLPTQEFIESENDVIRRINEGPSGKAKEKPAVKAPEPRASKKEEPAASSSFRVAQVRIVDGKAVVDSESLVINRREMAEANQGPLELVDESSRPRFVNSLTYAPLRGTRKRWTPEENELFFRSLRTYGTDFAMIASVIPERNRYDIKNKFKKEEKLNGKRITDLLLRRAEPVAAALPVTPTVGPDGLPVSLQGYSMVNTPEPQHGAAGSDDEEELPDARGVVTFASNTK
ncbi:hypothetical protein IWW37_000491 [Coemansia sp. RSA 2050]|nr:hypothetical protein IWW37_000491 [Coemansia sp. RSA 2050]